MRSINPATGECVQEFATLTPEAMEHRLNVASDAALVWRRLSFEERAGRLRAMATLLRERQDPLAHLMTTEMGKPIRESVGEVVKCAWVCEHYAEHAAEMLAPKMVEAQAKNSFVRFDPMGIILSIMPWNFPFWQVFRFAAPALMVGNVLLLKHAPNVQGVAEAIEAIARDAGLGDGVLSNLPIDVEQVSALIQDSRISAVTLTGSDRAGRAVGSLAGQALKKAVLELGGSDPAIVLADADLESAIPLLIKGRMLNSGQSCCAIKRLIVHADIYDDFVARYAKAVKALLVGDPTDPATDVGPLARPDLVDALDEQVRASVAAGARVVVGGCRVEGVGNFYAPTLIAEPPVGSPVCDDEIFGPVATVFKVQTVDEAVQLANATRFGLCASIWTQDRAAAMEMVEQLEVGGVFINKMPGSDPRLPFGGVKDSGYGRELGLYGLMEFVNVKTVCID